MYYKSGENLYLSTTSGRVFFMTNDQFFLFPMLSYGYKNTVGVVAHLFFSDPPLRPHATNVLDDNIQYY